MFIDNRTVRIGIEHHRCAWFGGGGKTVQYVPTETQEEKKKLKKSRSALFMTEGGAAGEELGISQTRQRDTLFGN